MDIYLRSRDINIQRYNCSYIRSECMYEYMILTVAIIIMTENNMRTYNDSGIADVDCIHHLGIFQVQFQQLLSDSSVKMILFSKTVQTFHYATLRPQQFHQCECITNVQVDLKAIDEQRRLSGWQAKCRLKELQIYNAEIHQITAWNAAMIDIHDKGYTLETMNDLFKYRR